MGHFAKGRQARADGLIAWNTNRLLAYLLDVDDLGPSAGAWRVQSASIAGSVVTVNTQANHGLTTNDEVEIWGLTGLTNAAGIFQVTVTDADTFTYTASSPSGTHTAGTGYLVNLTAPTNLSDINVSGTADIAKVALSVTGRSTNNGFLDLPDAAWTAVTGDQVEMMALVKAADTDVSTNDANEAVQRLILCMTPVTASLSGLPQTPTSGTINLNFNAQGLGRV